MAMALATSALQATPFTQVVNHLPTQLESGIAPSAPLGSGSLLPRPSPSTRSAYGCQTSPSHLAPWRHAILTEERLGLRSNHICKDTTDKTSLPKSRMKFSCREKLPLPTLMLVSRPLSEYSRNEKLLPSLRICCVKKRV